MSGLRPKKNHSNDTVSKNSRLESALDMTDIQNIKNWIQEAAGKDQKNPLSQEKKEKIQLLWSSLRKISGGNTEISNLNLDTFPQDKSNPNKEKEANDTNQVFNFLRQKSSNLPLQKQQTFQEKKNSAYQGIDQSLQNTLKSKSSYEITEHNANLKNFHCDMDKLAKSVSELCRIVSLSGIQGSYSSFGKTLLKIENIVKEYSLQNVGNTWKVALQYFKKLDFQNLHEKINALSCQMESIKCVLDQKNCSKEPVLDEKILSILNNTHNLLSLLKLLNEKISAKEALSINTKLSDIKAIVEKNEQFTESYTQKFVKKCDERLENIGTKIQNIQNEVLSQKKSTEQKLQSLEVLDQRLQNLDTHVQNITRQLEEKQNTPQNNVLLRNLERQITSIKEVVTTNTRDQKLSQEVAKKIFYLEDFIVQTANKTAKSMLNSLDGRQALETILKNNMHEYFKKVQQVQAEQTIKNFTTLYDMLVKIIQKLENPLEENRKPSSVLTNFSPNFQSSLPFANTSHTGKVDGISQTKLESNKLSIKENLSLLFASKHLFNGKPNKLHDNPKTYKESFDDREEELDIPHDIQQILERVSSIQNGNLEDDTIPHYISAVRRAASKSVIGDETLKKKQSYLKERGDKIKSMIFNKWVTSMMLAATLIASSFLLAPSLVGTTFFFRK
ncbi:hypothetical protein AYO25_02770 [Candidatus Liberibacter solanacearum]|uniref:Peptidoglycan-binding protein n=2 Tax=Candidatus Liberibacter solanacearum TaxID=556287 RepID=A0A1V2N871_9HYPH|nr:hypothetical protein AYJ09_02210 [Candidatus Liberibacter solanacearum]ONI59686.1 hypothetical protein AYO25_02770 [Candidatus Liberibacter solanacearum]